MTWVEWTLIAGAVGGVLRFLWVSVLDETSLKESFTQQEKREVEKKRIQSKEEQAIYQRLADRVERLHDRVEKNRSDIDNWKEKYYGERDNNRVLKSQNEELKRQNKKITKANKQLQRSLLTLRNILEKVLDRLSEHEDFEDIPDLPGLSITEIDDELLTQIHQPRIQTPLGSVFEGYAGGEMDDPTDADLEPPSEGETSE